MSRWSIMDGTALTGNPCSISPTFQCHPSLERPLSGTAHLPLHENHDSFISCIKGFKPLTHSCPISISGSPGRSAGSWKGGTETQLLTVKQQEGVERRIGCPPLPRDSALALWTLMIQVCPVLLLGRVQTKWLGLLLQRTQGECVCRSITPSKKWPQQGSEG